MQQTTKYCNCHNCKHPSDHLTSYHTCGKCNGYGHGFAECHMNHNNSYDYQNNLSELKPKFMELPKEKHCTILSCKAKHTHSTKSHQPFFSQDNYGGVNGPDRYGITARHAEITENSKLINNLPGSYIAMYWGMGTMFVFRNVGGKIEKLETTGNYSNFVHGLKEIKEPKII